jgi:hypothetical protein
MNTAIAAKIARMTATPEISAVITVDAASGRNDQHNVCRNGDFRRANVSLDATTSTSTTTRTVFSSRPGVAVTTSCQSRTARAGCPIDGRCAAHRSITIVTDAPIRISGTGGSRSAMRTGKAGRCGPSSGCAAHVATRGPSRPHPARRRPRCPPRLHRRSRRLHHIDKAPAPG